MEITTIGNGNASYFEYYTGGPVGKGQTALGIIEEDYAVGAAVYSAHDGVIFIEHLLIDEDYRRRGLGAVLVDAAVECAENIGSDRIMTFYEEDDAVTQFLRKIGFVCMPGDRMHGIPVKEIFASENFKKIKDQKPDPDVVPLSKVKKADLQKIRELLMAVDFAEELVDDEAYEPELSYAVFENETGAVCGALLARHMDDDVNVTALVVSEERHMLLRKLLSAFAVALFHQTKKESRLCFVGANEKLTETLSKLVGVPIPAEKTVWRALLQM